MSSGRELRLAISDESLMAPAAGAVPPAEELVQLIDILGLVLPALGPLVAARLRCIGRSVAEACSTAELAAVARGPVWHAYLEAAAPPLVQLLGSVFVAAAGSPLRRREPAAAVRAVSHAAALGELRPGGHAATWAPDARGLPPLVVAACFGGRSGAGPVVAALLRARAPPNSCGADCWTALMWASSHGDVETCAVLLREGANVNAVAKDGTSALLCAARADHSPLRVVNLLLEHRADPALVPMQSPFDEYVDFEVRQALATATRTSRRRL